VVLVVLYSINVFITFSLSQLGMVRHWWKSRKELKVWRKKIFINGIGLIMTSGILVSLTIIKFSEGGWVTLLVTGGLVAAAFLIKRHYENTRSLMNRLDSIVDAVAMSPGVPMTGFSPAVIDPKGKTAVFLINGYNGIGLHTVLNVQRIFSGVFKNYLFLQVGVLDAGTFKGVSELERLEEHLRKSSDQYVRFIQGGGFHAEAINVIGTDVVEEVEKVVPEILKKYPQPVFFGGQLVFPQETFWSKWLHNYIVFALQRKFYHQGLPFLVMPIRVETVAA
jgi:K+ transporter